MSLGFRDGYLVLLDDLKELVRDSRASILIRITATRGSLRVTAADPATSSPR